MSLPYYYTEQEVSNSPGPNSSLFKLALEKVSKIHSSYLNAYDSDILKQYHTTNTLSNIQQIRSKPTRKSLESCIQFPNVLEYKSRFMTTSKLHPNIELDENNPTIKHLHNYVGNFLNKSLDNQAFSNNKIEKGNYMNNSFCNTDEQQFLKQKYNVDAKGDLLMERMKLNNFIYNDKQKNSSQTEQSNQFSNYKYKQTTEFNNQNKNYDLIQTKTNNFNDEKNLVPEVNINYNQNNYFENNEKTKKKILNFGSEKKNYSENVYNVNSQKKNMSNSYKKTENELLTKNFPLDLLETEKKREQSRGKRKKKIFDLSVPASIGSLSNKFQSEKSKKSNIFNSNGKYYSQETMEDFIRKCHNKKIEIIDADREQFIKKLQLTNQNDLERAVFLLKSSFADQTAILFENYELKIGMKCSISQNIGNQDSYLSNEPNSNNNGLLILLYYCNKNRSTIEDCILKFDYVQNLNKIKVFPAVFDFSIEGNATRRQDFYIENYNIDDEIITLSLQYKNKAFDSYKIFQKISFPLPMCINKFMEFKPIDNYIFKSKWRMFQGNIVMSNPYQYDTTMLVIPSDFIKYFPFFVDLHEKNSKNSRNSKIKWGGIFSINGDQEFLMKIIILENKYIVFQVSDDKKNRLFAKKIIDTFSFMFTK